MLDVSKLKIGDEVRCIDVEGFIAVLDRNKNLLDSKNPFIVKSINDNYISFRGDVNGVRNVIFESEYEFFEKVEGKPKTFDDLSDAVFKAYKDGVLTKVSFENGSPNRHISYTYGSIPATVIDLCNDYSESIALIESLYKKEFVIDDYGSLGVIADDIKNKPQIRFINGFESAIVSVDLVAKSITISDDAELCFDLIKGSTAIVSKNGKSTAWKPKS